MLYRSYFPIFSHRRRSLRHLCIRTRRHVSRWIDAAVTSHKLVSLTWQLASSCSVRDRCVTTFRSSCLSLQFVLLSILTRTPHNVPSGNQWEHISRFEYCILSSVKALVRSVTVLRSSQTSRLLDLKKLSKEPLFRLLSIFRPRKTTADNVLSSSNIIFDNRPVACVDQSGLTNQ